MLSVALKVSMVGAGYILHRQAFPRELYHGHTGQSGLWLYTFLQFD